MTADSTGGMRLREILALPVLYDLLQKLVRADDCRRNFVLNRARPESGMRVLDIGCGTARVLRWLPDGASYVGVDVNPRYIAAARKEYGPRGEFLVVSSGVSGVEDRGPFDLVMAMFLLHHLSDEEALGMCRAVRGMLAPGGRLVTIDPCVAERRTWLEKFMMDRDRGAFIRPSAGYRDLVSRVFPKVDVREQNNALRVRYTHAIMTAWNT